MNASEHLTAWNHPQYYGGFSPDGDYVVLTRHRDSGLLTLSNWNAACKQLHAEPYDEGTEGMADRPAAYHFRTGHWAVGWVEYLLVRVDAPDDMLTTAGELVCALADYLVLDEDDYSERQYRYACETWERASIRERLDAIERSRADVSIFAARRDDLPSDDCGALFDYLTGE